MFFDNPRGNRKPEAGARLFGGKKGIEQALFDLRGNTRSGIAHIEDHNIPGPVAETRCVEARPQSYSAVLAYALGCILDEVDEHLLNLLGIDANLGSYGVFTCKTNVGFRKLRVKKRLNFSQNLARRNGDKLRFRRPGKKEDIPHDAFQTADFIGDDLGIFVLG